MNNRVIMMNFINEIERLKLMTNFIKNIFEYEEFEDYNYLFRMKYIKKVIIIDIYDNISSNRFNRYLFSFTKGDYDVKVVKTNNVYETYINVYTMNDSDNKLYKLAYLFSLNKRMMINYAKSFLNQEFVDILNSILNKPIH